ncbi:MAG: tetratricopeptide repeat protein, partial [Thermodesulfovibrionales bacterium]
IAGLPDVAFTFFYLLSFYLYISFRAGIKRGYLLSILSFSVATLFKEPALSLPVILIAYDYVWKKLDKTMLAGIKRYMPYAAVSGVYLLARYYALRGFAPLHFYPDLSTYQFIINVFPLFREYLASLIWPLHLTVWHTFHPINSLFEANGMISIVVTLIFCIVTAVTYRRNKAVFFGLLLLVFPLLPVFYIKGISGKPFSERYLYLPSVGFVFLLAIFLSWTKEKLPRAVGSVTIVFTVIGGLYTVATIARNNVWKDDFSLWSDTVKTSPDSFMGHYNLGMAYVSQGELDSAIAEFQTAIRLNPAYADAHYNLGLACASQGQWDSAIAEYEIAIQLVPTNAKAHNNLGNAYVFQGQLDRAVAEFQTALRLNPAYVKAHNNLGIAYQSQGQVDSAITEFQAALQLNPDYVEAHTGLGIAYQSQGQVDSAITEFQTALQLNPNFHEARRRLNDILSKRAKAPS